MYVGDLHIGQNAITDVVKTTKWFQLETSYNAQKMEPGISYCLDVKVSFPA